MPRRRARATALAPTSSEAPPTVDNAAPILFDRAPSAAPATPPMSAAKMRSLAFGEAKSGDRSADISWALIVPILTFTCAHLRKKASVSKPDMASMLPPLCIDVAAPSSRVGASPGHLRGWCRSTLPDRFTASGESCPKRPPSTVVLAVLHGSYQRPSAWSTLGSGGRPARQQVAAVQGLRHCQTPVGRSRVDT